jgi:hypothetical protein
MWYTNARMLHRLVVLKHTWTYHNKASILIHHHHSVFCLTTDSKPPPKSFLHTVRSRASSFRWEYPLLSLRSSSSFLRLLPRLLVTYISPFIFLSIICFRRQFLRKMWSIQLAFRFLTSRRQYSFIRGFFVRLFIRMDFHRKPTCINSFYSNQMHIIY